jgi:hypothetical protein
MEVGFGQRHALLNNTSSAKQGSHVFHDVILTTQRVSRTTQQPAFIKSEKIRTTMMKHVSRQSARASRATAGQPTATRALLRDSSTVSSSSSSSSDRMSHDGSAAPRLMYPVIPKSDHGPFKEYSVIHTDRSLNLMSDPFQRVMRDLNQLLKVTYNADKVVIIPG